MKHYKSVKSKINTRKVTISHEAHLPQCNNNLLLSPFDSAGYTEYTLFVCSAVDSVGVMSCVADKTAFGNRFHRPADDVTLTRNNWCWCCRQQQQPRLRCKNYTALSCARAMCLCVCLMQCMCAVFSDTLYIVSNETIKNRRQRLDMMSLA